MGFLQLAEPDVPVDTSLGLVISFWFRIPSASISSVHSAFQELMDAYDNDDTGCVRPPPANSGLIPLITFGKRQVEKHDWDFCGHTQSEYTHIDTVGTSRTNEYYWNCVTCVFDFQGLGTNPITTVFWNDPTFIGDYCDNSGLFVNARGAVPVFDFRFQYDWAAGPPTVSGTSPELTAWSTSPDPISSWRMDGAGCPISGCEPSGAFIVDGIHYAGEQSTVTYVQEFTDRPYENFAPQPEAFAGVPDLDGSDGSFGTAVSSGHWHHVILSLEIKQVATAGTQGGTPYNTSAAAVGAASTIFLSFDDANKTGQQISLCCPNDFGAGPNDLITILGRQLMLSWTEQNGFSGFGSVTGSGTVEGVDKSGIHRPSYDYTPPTFNLQTINIPGDSDTVQVVEMAELQVFAGVTLDTSDEANRRLFVTAGGRPADMALASAQLGTPVIALKGSGNWIAGVNTGTAGHADPTGTITIFTPGPALGT